MLRIADEYEELARCAKKRLRELARECFKLANQVPLGEARRTVLDMAREWEQLAEQQKQRRRHQHVAARGARAAAGDAGDRIPQ
jgi:hypothetical protein